MQDTTQRLLLTQSWVLDHLTHWLAMFTKVWPVEFNNTLPRCTVRRGILRECRSMNIEWWCGLASGLCGVGAVCLLLLTVDAMANGGRGQ